MTIAGVVRQPRAGTLRLSEAVNGRQTLTCTLLSPDGSYRPGLDEELILVEPTGATSTTSLAVGTGSKTLTIASGLPLLLGERVRIFRQADPTIWMEGPITSYTGTSLTVNVTATSGSGTYSDWEVGRRIFGGFIQARRERGLGGHGVAALEHEITAIDYRQLAERRVVNLALPAGTLRQALEALDDYLVPYGVSLDPDQATGPSIGPLTLDYASVLQALDAVSDISGWVWEIDSYKLLRMFAWNSRAAPVNIDVPSQRAIGDIEVEPTREDYANRVIVLYNQGSAVVQADNTTEQAARGLWEVVVRAPEVTDATTAQAIADTYLAQHAVAPKTVRYRTWAYGLRAGQSQTINIPERGINNTVLLLEVNAEDTGRVDRLLRAVTARESGQIRPGWRDTYRAWSGGVSGGGIFAGPLTGGTAAATRIYYLGGTLSEWVQSPTPDWVPLTGVQVQIQRTGAATVFARVRARAGSITLRLRNVSDGTTAGTSAPVTSTTLQLVTFGVTLQAGKLYELQGLSSLANSDIQAVGAYVE
ncbi:MAG TPA: hypothetical protein VNI83_04585 [Vicinamibacterales bacterium]|nr:hypothetical protein [Vicinamibacterales bacterium]